MAFKISYTILANDKISAVARKIAASTKLMSNSFSKAAFQIDVLGTKTEKNAKKISASQRLLNGTAGMLGRTLVGLTAGYMGIVGAQRALQTGMRFEDKIAEVSAITGAVGKDLQFISDESLRLGRKTFTSAEEVAEGFKLIASAKADLLDYPEKLSQVTEQAIILKNAAGVDLANASMTLGTALNQFGAGAEEAARFTDVLAAGAKYGASEIVDTSEALKVSGTAANVAGISFEETNAAIQALAAGGLKGSIAGRGFSAVLLRAQKAGLNFKKVGLAKGFEIIRDKINAIQDPAERSKAIMKTFGLENVKTIETLMLQAHTLDDLTKKMHERGIAMEQANAQNRTVSKSFRLVGIAVQEKVIKVFDKLKPSLNSLAASMLKFVDSMGEEQIYAIAEGFKVVGKSLWFVYAIAAEVFAFIKGIGVHLGNIVGVVGAFTSGAVFSGDFLTNMKGLISNYARGTEGAFKIGGESPMENFINSFSDKSANVSGANAKDTLDINLSLNGNTEQVASVTSKHTGRRRVRSRTNMGNSTAMGVRG